MSDKPDRVVVDEAQEGGEKKSRGIARWMMIALGGLVVFIIVGLLVAVLGAVANSDGVSNFFRILRDFFIIVLALQGILICLALVILIVQLTALINLLSSEVKPIIDEARETITTARGTAEFVSKNVSSPVIRASSTLTGVRVFLREMTGIRRNLSGRASRNRR
jgi:hypothetical protein